MKPAAKRTRVSKGQSKNGCFTCKARKVKCDEQKPKCLRCQQAKLECGGYPYRAIEDDSVAQTSQRFDNPETSNRPELTALSPYDSSPASDFETIDPAEEQGLVRAGLDLLLNSYDDEYAVGQDVLRSLISSHVWSSPVVTTACAAFGAATKLQQRPRSHLKHLSVVFETLYGQAMRMVKYEIESLQYDRYAVLACCIILIATEAILRRRQNALKHLRGACQIFYASPQDSSTAMAKVAFHSSGKSGTSAGSGHGITDIDVDFLLRIYHMNTLCFANYASVPGMHSISLADLENMMHQIHLTDLTRSTFLLLHASFSFINKASHSAIEQTLMPHMQSDHSKYISLLQQLITTLTSKYDSSISGPGQIHLLVLRNICISTMIGLHTVFAEQETVWDFHASSFEQLISSAEVIIRSHREWKVIGKRPDVVGFTTQPGVLQPLYLAALKYRNSDWRRRAVQCLRAAEREGPWIGEMLAAVAQRTMDIEETSTMTGMTDGPTTLHELHRAGSGGTAPGHVPEQARISYVSIMEENGAVNGDPWPSANSGRTMIRILKRKQPISILPVLVATSPHLGQEESVTPHLDEGQLDPNYWTVEREWIEFGPGQDYRILHPTQHFSE